MIGLFGSSTKNFEWKNKGLELLSQKQPKNKKVIRIGQKIKVHRGQVAVVIHEGCITDVVSDGIHYLNSSTLPILASLLAWGKKKKGTFKGLLYFVNISDYKHFEFMNHNFSNVVTTRYGKTSLQISAKLSFRIKDPKSFIKYFIGSKRFSSNTEVIQFINGQIRTYFDSFFNQNVIDVMEFMGSKSTYSTDMLNTFKPMFNSFGMELEDFIIADIKNKDKHSSKLIKKELRNQSFALPASHKVSPYGITGNYNDTSYTTKTLPPRKLVECIYCGELINADSVKCEHCNSKVKQAIPEIKVTDKQTRCLDCGKLVNDNFKFCPYCSSNLNQRTSCNGCGDTVQSEYSFCPSCGTHATHH